VTVKSHGEYQIELNINVGSVAAGDTIFGRLNLNNAAVKYSSISANSAEDHTLTLRKCIRLFPWGDDFCGRPERLLQRDGQGEPPTD
jgi:hypothetical protein